MKTELKKPKITQYIPFFVMVACAVISITVYVAKIGNHVPAVHLLAALSTSLIPLLFPLFYALSGKRTDNGDIPGLDGTKILLHRAVKSNQSN